MRRLRLVVVSLALLLGAMGADAAQIVVTATAVEPAVLRVAAGERVDFVNRTERNVHVEFGVDPERHHVVQVPSTGPIWAVFHRPGTHAYAVHVYGGGRLTTLLGRVEVADNPAHPWGETGCAVVVGEICVVP